MLLNCDEHGKSLLKRIGELETYNRQINRLEEVRLLRLQHAKNKLLRRSFDEVSVLSFGCTASCGSPQQAGTRNTVLLDFLCLLCPCQAQSPTDASNRSDASDLAAIRGTTLAPLEPRKEWSPDAKADADGGAQKLADSWQAQLHSTRAKLKNRHDQLEQLEQLQQQSSTIQDCTAQDVITQRQAQAAQNFGCSKAAMSDLCLISQRLLLLVYNQRLGEEFSRSCVRKLRECYLELLDDAESRSAEGAERIETRLLIAAQADHFTKANEDDEMSELEKSLKKRQLRREVACAVNLRERCARYVYGRDTEGFKAQMRKEASELDLDSAGPGKKIELLGGNALLSASNDALNPRFK
eukprot:g23862.t1